MTPRREREMTIREFMASPPFNKRELSEDEVKQFSTALTHDSYSNEEASRNNPVEPYERLEFLGDAVLRMIVCEHFFHQTEEYEGPMSIRRDEIVSNENVSLQASRIGIDKVLRVGAGHRDRRTGANKVEDKMRADALEAVIAAVYLNYGLEEASRIVREVFLTEEK